MLRHGYKTKLTTIANAGELDALPDIFLIQDASFQKFAQNYPEIFTDLTDSGIDFSQFSAAKTSYSIVNGKNMGIPFDSGTAVNCIRTDYLEQAGFTVEDFTDITWSDYMEKADKKRSAYYNYYSYKTWGAAETYHLCIDSSVLGIDGTVQFIKQFVKLKLGY